MRLYEAVALLRGLAPEELAEPWDHVGLQVGDVARQVKRGLLCVDLSEAVLAEAGKWGAQLVVAYHPPIFKPLQAVSVNQPEERLILRACEAQIAVYSPHTALDAAAGGVNDWLCGAISRVPGALVRPIRPVGEAGAYKLVTFVPPKDLDALRAALTRAGAGRIGAYSDCSFSAPGRGSFRGGAGTHPTIGRPGRLELVDEQRLEVLVPRAALTAVVAALRGAHPYEEPAFDIYRLEAAPDCGAGRMVAKGKPGLTPGPACRCDTGPGRVVTLPRPVAGGARGLAKRVAGHLGLDGVELAVPAGAKTIKTVAFCAGAGGSLLKDAGPIDAFVTGEMRHHDVREAVARGVAVVLAGHTQTERPYLKVYRGRIAAATGPGVKWKVSTADRAPSVRVGRCGGRGIG